MTDSSTASKAEAAKDQASQLKDEALSSGQHVAETAADQAGSVIGEAKVQAKDLFSQTQSELRDQAGAQQKRVASGLRSVSDELTDMADNSSSSGVASDLVSQAAGRVGSVATWLEGRDPGTLLSDVRAYAARKPGTFIAVAAIAGVVAGRLTRSLAGNAKDAKEEAADVASTPDTSAPAASLTTPAYDSPAYDATLPTSTSAYSTGLPATSGTDAFAAPATFTDPLEENSVGASSVESSSVESTYAAPAYTNPAYADAAPIDDQALRSHSVDDEYGDASTVESLFDEPAAETPSTPSFDETIQGDDYRGDRS